MASAERALELAREVGFDLVGIAPVRAPRDVERWRAWLAAGRNAGLDYLARDAELVADPLRWAPTGRSMLVVGLAHSRPAVELAGGGRVARYAAGRDYHNVVLRKLRRLRRRLTEEGLIRRDNWSRVAVDAVPLLERSHAAEAGVGFVSKAANLLHPSFGPWFFLGELLLDIDLAPTPQPPPGSCGTCTACLDACPTEAILSPGVVDARLCISYHTIESRGPTPRELRSALGPWVFGCDVCSEVCPWGARAPNLAERFSTHRTVSDSTLADWLLVPDDGSFRVGFEGSPLQRALRVGLARNAAVVLGNLREHDADAALLEALENATHAMVREAAGWALARTRGESRTVRAAIERAWTREPESPARDDLRRTLDGEL